MRRLFPFLLVVGFALVGLGWGLTSLWRIFTRERSDALEALATERSALEQYAEAALAQQLHVALLNRFAALEAGNGDPRAADSGVYWSVERAQFPVIDLPTSVAGPTVVRGEWYLEPQGGAVRGIQFKMSTVVASVATEMRQRGLLERSGKLFAHAREDVAPVDRLQFSVEVPRWERAAHDIEARHSLKLGLLLACGGLAVGVIVLAGVTQWRRLRLLELKSDLIANVSHELRTPLASIRLLGETLSKRMAPEAKDYPERIVREADGLSFLVENVLSFNRIRKGRWRLQRSQVSLEELFSNLRSGDPPEVRTALQLQLETGGLMLDGDPALLQLLFSNLLRNARAYNARAPVRVGIRVPHPPEPVILITDNGVGIAPGEWERIFEEFYRIPQSNLEVHGSGLGLAICRRIAQLHGGAIRVAASSPEGTTFELALPGIRA